MPDRAKQNRTHTPRMSDSAVQAKTGKTWQAWFTLLDRAKVQTLGHTAIAELLRKKHGVPGWWSQGITVEYERSRGLREVYQTSRGYEASATKTIGVSVADLFAATATPARRKKWFPRGSLEVSSQTQDKYLNGAWKGGARLNIGFYAKGADKAQIAIQVSKLTSQKAVEAERTAWKAALGNLADALVTAAPAPGKK